MFRSLLVTVVLFVITAMCYCLYSKYGKKWPNTNSFVPYRERNVRSLPYRSSRFIGNFNWQVTSNQAQESQYSNTNLSYQSTIGETTTTTSINTLRNTSLHSSQEHVRLSLEDQVPIELAPDYYNVIDTLDQRMQPPGLACELDEDPPPSYEEAVQNVR